MKLSPQGVPADVGTSLRAAYLASRVRLEGWLEPGIELLIEALSAEGIEPVLLKGAALAYTAYPDPALRSMGDIDLLVPPCQIEDARATLLNHGFLAEAGDEGTDHHLPPLQSPNGHVRVELHHSLLQRSSPYHVDTGEIRSRCMYVEIGQTEAIVLDPTDALQHACLHLSYSHLYRWFPLRGLVDILALASMGPTPSVDWHLFLDSSKRWRTQGACYWPLKLSRHLLGAPVPDFVLGELAPPRPIEGILAAAFVPESILRLDVPPTGADAVLRELLLHLAMYSGCPFSMQFRVVTEKLFPSREIVRHLPPEVLDSRFRYSLQMAHPKRLLRGVVAFGRLAAKARGSAPGPLA